MKSEFFNLTKGVRGKLKSLLGDKVISKEVYLSKEKISFKADIQINNDSELIFIEIKESQTHPDTNVSKYWVYLEGNLNKKVKLIQIFGRGFSETENNYTSRKKLSEFIAKKIKLAFPKNFAYVPLNLKDFNYSQEDYKNKGTEITDKVIELLKEYIDRD